MVEVSVFDDLETVERLWQGHWPQISIFDLWPVRACFQAQYNRSPYFLVAQRDGRFLGMLALSWIQEEQCFGHFPGEIWQGKTWLEQNRILASDPGVSRALLNAVPSAARIRYLTGESLRLAETPATVDEIGYLFLPEQHHYSFETYMQGFSGKSRKNIRRELERLTTRGVSYRYDCFEDLDHLFRLNLECFQERSYFSDGRFLKSFENLAAWLRTNNLLRLTTVVIGGKIAAVDLGAVWRSTYTVLAGGTHPDFPGVAKLINLHHMQWACRQRLATVDFLCGEFNWKKRFHLTSRPLYEILIHQVRQGWQAEGLCDLGLVRAV
jgi:hypothetical protein